MSEKLNECCEVAGAPCFSSKRALSSMQQDDSMLRQAVHLCRGKATASYYYLQ